MTFFQQECTYLFNLNNVQSHIFVHTSSMWSSLTKFHSTFIILKPIIFFVLLICPLITIDLYHKVILLFNISSTIAQHPEDLNHSTFQHLA